MPIKSFKPVTPTRRYQTVVTRDELTKGKKPEKLLTTGKQRSGGRTSTGRISSRFRGGGHKRTLREVDFKRDKAGVPAKVAALEYDPNRSAHLALLNYADGEKRYILAPVGLSVGQSVVSGPEADIFVGNALPLKNIPPGTFIHNVELRPGKGGQMVRSAGGRSWFPKKASTRW
jgi:large subunit ribosomal protein L2